MTHDAETLTHQFEVVFQQHVDEIDISNNWDKVRSTLNRDLNAISSYTILLLVRFKDTQKILLDLLTSNNNKLLNPLNISPTTLEQQLSKLISEVGLTKSVMSNGRIIMEVKLPLVTLEDYQIFKLVPISTKLDEVSLLRERMSKNYKINT